MKTEEHLEESHLTRLRLGELTPDEVIAVTTHLATCEACRSIGAGHADDRLRGIADRLLRDSAAEHPDEALLTGYVDGTLPSDEHERVEAHLGICERCSVDVDDLREVAASMTAARRFGSRRRILLAIAAIVIVAVTLLLLRPSARTPEPMPQPPIIRRTPSQPAPPPAEPALKPEWAALVADAIRTGRLPAPPELREIQASPETVRGGGKPRAEAISPAEEIVESDRPTFTWPAQKNATAVVFVYRGDDELMTSPPMRGTEWTPAKPLPRGVPLAWQVELQATDGTTRIVPAPPDPPAMFRILDEAARREIEEASRLQPRNDLLLGVLYARAGLKARAIEALDRHAGRHPEATSLLRSVQKWP